MSRAADVASVLAVRDEANPIPAIDSAMPTATAQACHDGSPGSGHATIPRKSTLIDEIR